MGRTGRKHGGNALQGRILFLFRQGAFRQSLLDGDLILRAGLPQLAPVPRLLRKSHNIAAGVLPSLAKLMALSDYGRLMGLRSITSHTTPATKRRESIPFTSAREVLTKAKAPSSICLASS